MINIKELTGLRTAHSNNTEEDTEFRLDKMSEELNRKPVIRTFPNTDKYDMMIIIRSIDWSSNCEHHKVAVNGKAYVGYIPNEDYYVGASKLARIVEYFLNPLTEMTQEDANARIVKEIKKLLEPLGVICVLVGKHTCMGYRGVKQPNSDMVTSQITGEFKKATVRAEFFELLKLK